MLVSRISRLIAAISFVAVLFGPGQAFAANGRDFAGNYSVTKIYDSGDQVRVALTLHLVNYSGTDLTEVRVAVDPSQPPMEAFAAFPPVAQWRSRGDLVLAQELTVPLREYNHWRDRGQPNVSITYADESGREWRAQAQLSRRPRIAVPRIH